MSEPGTASSPAGASSRREDELPPPTPGHVVLRVHRARGEVVVAACDSELLETEVKVGRTSVKISSHFYGRIMVDPEEFESHLRRATIVNLLGERTIAWAVSAGLLSTEGVGLLGHLPHAEIVNLPS